jgi:hypothetical protein
VYFGQTLFWLSIHNNCPNRFRWHSVLAVGEEWVRVSEGAFNEKVLPTMLQVGSGRDERIRSPPVCGGKRKMHSERERNRTKDNKEWSCE